MGNLDAIGVHRRRAENMGIDRPDGVDIHQALHRHKKNPKWLIYMIYAYDRPRFPSPPWHLFTDGVEWICKGITNKVYEEDAKRIRKADKE